MILDWNKDLIKQADRSKGSTPLHVAASWGYHDVISLLLRDDPSAAYRPDHDGSFPIHVAAVDGQVKAVKVLLQLDRRKDRNPAARCAGLRDARGRSFLHVAVAEGCQSVVAYACKLGKLEPAVMNMQDDDGNTALHLAVQASNLWIFNLLMEWRRLELNLTNNKGETPCDVAWIKKPIGLYFRLSPRVKIYNLLKAAGGEFGNHRWDHFQRQHSSTLDEEAEAKKLSESTQTIGIGSVLIATVAFAAAFAPPGDYGDDGAPNLAKHYAFGVFIIADTLAFICAGLSIISLMYAGVAAVDLHTRMSSFVFSAVFMASSARSLGVAFAFGIYVMLAPVARTTAIAACVVTGLALVDVAFFVWVVATGEVMLLKRLGVLRAWWRLPSAILGILLMQFWPYIVIVVVVLYSKMKGVH
ncbi:protein ACCELERATED CELL DEATH 6-like [Oryza brachyantha]|uniref:protein ACCELERATED CELL DEATH 6-like n=1 Tax=Oryza brachyantha TaxID=4533 RepID=UPI001ADA04FF|nr:protein ACCELERATED CELL DEATH 6-like [Oryza brachyantha]